MNHHDHHGHEPAAEPNREEIITMETPPIVSPLEWENAREELLVKEKELTRARDALAATLKRLTEVGLEPEPVRYPGGSEGPKTSWLTDPDGYRIELVEWPPGHPDGITEADFS
jgi:hypothetical protein